MGVAAATAGQFYWLAQCADHIMARLCWGSSSSPDAFNNFGTKQARGSFFAVFGRGKEPRRRMFSDFDESTPFSSYGAAKSAKILTDKN